MKHSRIQVLKSCEAGSRGIVIVVKGDKEFQKRLIGMGLHAGSEIEVLHQGEKNAPMLIVLGETRLALGQDMAAQILITPLTEAHSSLHWITTALKRCFGDTWHGGHHEKMLRRFKRREHGENCRIREGKFGLS